jgi:hypothetical protein
MSRNEEFLRQLRELRENIATRDFGTMSCNRTWKLWSKKVICGLKMKKLNKASKSCAQPLEDMHTARTSTWNCFNTPYDMRKEKKNSQSCAPPNISHQMLTTFSSQTQQSFKQGVMSFHIWKTQYLILKGRMRCGFVLFSPHKAFAFF